MIFSVNRLRLCFRPLDTIQFPAGKAANTLRGALGTIAPDWFAPSAVSGPSGLRNRPRPFVLRAAHLDGATIAKGEAFYVEANLFDRRDIFAAAFVDALSAVARKGIGVGRGAAELISCTRQPLELELAPKSFSIPKILVRFVTPTELKDKNALASRPEFPILFARVRDRVSALSTFYGDGPLEVEFKALGERATLVRMTGCATREIEIHRRSSRTGQVHPIGGFVGEAEYEGKLAEFIPFLEAAQFSGVGRHTVWGKGQIEVCVPRSG
jgi:hypothetical protein